MQSYTLTDPSDRAMFDTYWCQNVQGQPLIDVLCLAFFPQLSLYYSLVLRTEATDMTFVVDTAGARVTLGRTTVEEGQEAENSFFVGDDSCRFWKRFDSNLVGQHFEEITCSDITLDWGYTYCNKVRITFEDYLLTLQDVQDQMQVRLHHRTHLISLEASIT